MKISPTQRTLKLYRESGYLCAITERWNSYAKIRQDLFGFIDLVAIAPGIVVGIQTCAGASHAARREKILALPAARAWLEAGGAIHVVSWSKRKPRGQKRATWANRIECILIEDFDGKVQSGVRNGTNLQVRAGDAESTGEAAE